MSDEKRNPLFPVELPEPKTERVKLLHGVEVEVREILSGCELEKIDQDSENRNKGRFLLQENTGLEISKDKIEWWTWLEASCSGVFENGEKIGEGLTFDEIVKGSTIHKDRLDIAGLRAWALTTGVDLEAKKGESETDTSPTPEDESSE